MPDAAQFEADDARADDAEAFGDVAKGERFAGADDVLPVHFGDGDIHRHGAEGEDDAAACLVCGNAAVGGGDFDGFARQQAAASGEPVDAVGFEELFDAAGELFDDVVFAGNHRGDVEFDVAGADAVRGEVVPRFFVEGGAFEQRFGGDAADVQAGAAEGGCCFDAGGFVAELGGADGGDVAAGATADDDDVVVFHGDFFPVVRGDAVFRLSARFVI